MVPEAIANAITLSIFEDDVHGKIAEQIPEYLNDGWEDEFEDIHEAYVETGRGEAESDVLRTIINDFTTKHSFTIDSDAFVEVCELLTAQWGLNHG